MRTMPVKYSAGPFAEGCEPLLVMSTYPPFILRIEFVLDVQLQAVACSETGHSLQLFGISRAMHRNL
jgi:hypothetical protein